MYIEEKEDVTNMLTPQEWKEEHKIITVSKKNPAYHTSLVINVYKSVQRSILVIKIYLKI